jgi:sigma-54 dependent transcriptional regulator, acetoin dehydrogenase operon transcriptional activator AcoR
VRFKGDTLSQTEQSRSGARKGAPALFVALECERPLAGPDSFSLRGIDTVVIGRGARRSARHPLPSALELEVPDGWMSATHVELKRSDDSWTVVDGGSKNGTMVDGRRISEALIDDGAVLQLGRTFFRFRTDFADREATLETNETLPSQRQLSTFSPAFADVVARLRAVAPTRVPVLIRGETGTGKEVLARALHASSRRHGAFVAVNSGAIAPSLLEAELFGHRKGAFSGADRDHPGLIQASDGGTLFLDEIGDLSLAGQAALLRVIQESEVMPVGGTQPHRLDLRVVAATHRDIHQLAREDRFRSDLLARLDGVTLEVPPLRDRPEDIAILIPVLLVKLAPERPDVALAPDAARALLEYHWPLNVRELEQALACGLALSGLQTIELKHLPRTLHEQPKHVQRQLTPEEVGHRDELILCLGKHLGNLSAVARDLGKGRTQVVRWMSRYGLDAEAFRNPHQTD